MTAERAQAGGRDERPTMLLFWGNAYMFQEAVAPMVPGLGEDFRIVLVLVDYWLPRGLRDTLDAWQREGVISALHLVPDESRLVRRHRALRRTCCALARRRFDVFVASSMMQVTERYLLDRVVGDDCLRVCYWPSSTYPMRRPRLRRLLLAGDANLAGFLDEPVGGRVDQERFRDVRSARRLASLVKWRLHTGAVRMRASARRAADRHVLPFLMTGRTFPLRRFDWVTQLGTDQFDALVMGDELEARALEVLYRNPNIYVAAHPSEGSCRCPSSRREDAVLVCLSGLESSDMIPPALSASWLRDVRIVLAESGASRVDLRPHPRATGTWPQAFCRYLLDQGVEARLVSADRPLREIVCDYLGVAGVVSSALRDARAACRHAFIVGFADASARTFGDPEPKLLVGAGEGIQWIEPDGSFRAIARAPYAAPARPSLRALLPLLSRPRLQERLSAYRKAGSHMLGEAHHTS